MSEPDVRYGQQVFAPDHHLQVFDFSLNPLGLRPCRVVFHLLQNKPLIIHCHFFHFLRKFTSN